MTRFSHFMAIDWSGALGARQKGIAIAICEAAGGNDREAPPRLLTPADHRHWSREGVLDLLLHQLPRDTLVGLDLGISLPFADAEAFFPGWEDSPADARALWALVEEICATDPHLSVSSFVDHPVLSAYFRRHGGREGTRFHLPGALHKRGRLRVTEAAQTLAGCKPYSNFNLVGAAQVGKSSLSGMRMLHRLGGALPVWPIDPLPREGSVVTEIYTTLAAVAAGRTAARAKVTDRTVLDLALRELGSREMGGTGPIDDHSADALITSAWLRKISGNPALWSPQGMTADIARTEGWTFGAI